MISAAYFSIRRKVLSIALFAVDILARLGMAPESTPLKLAGLTSSVPRYYEPNREQYHEEVLLKNDERREEGGPRKKRSTSFGSEIWEGERRLNRLMKVALDPLSKIYYSILSYKHSCNVSVEATLCSNLVVQYSLATGDKDLELPKVISSTVLSSIHYGDRV